MAWLSGVVSIKHFKLARGYEAHQNIAAVEF